MSWENEGGWFSPGPFHLCVDLRTHLSQSDPVGKKRMIQFFFFDSSSSILSHDSGSFSAATFLRIQVLHVWYSMKLSELWFAAGCLDPAYLKSGGGEEGGCPIRNCDAVALACMWKHDCRGEGASGMRLGQIFPTAFFPEDAVTCKFLRNPPWFHSLTSRWPWCSHFRDKLSTFNCWL